MNMALILTLALVVQVQLLHAQMLHVPLLTARTTVVLMMVCAGDEGCGVGLSPSSCKGLTRALVPHTPGAALYSHQGVTEGDFHGGGQSAGPVSGCMAAAKLASHSLCRRCHARAGCSWHLALRRSRGLG